jgi:hypothetical protein
VNATATFTWGTFLDFNEVCGWLQLSTQPTGVTQTLLQRCIDAACTRAQKMANRPFCPTLFMERHDGWSGEYIDLRYSPFLQLVLCREWQSSGGFLTLPESTPENNNFDGVQVDYATGRIMRTFAGYSWPRPFFPGSRNVEVTYKAGYNPVPADIWQATVDLVAYWWRNTQQASRSSGFRQPGEGGQYGGDIAQSGLWPGVPDRIGEVFSAERMPGIA